MVRVYADDALVYDSRLDDLVLLGLKATTSVKAAGTAELVLPPDHPNYKDFVGHRTVVTIYKGAEKLFRGRALYPSDDFLKRRTITCEGERGFLRDGVMRPYLYQDDPATIFTDVVTQYNAQVEAFKQFVVGEITVTDPNDYIRLESKSAERVSETVDKLIDRCGGYIVFTDSDDGRRVIHWLAELPYRSNQAIEFGENLLDYARTDADSDLATVILPYGAEDEEGNRVTIESVNDGLDFIQDDEAVALRGRIVKPVYYDDITEPLNLLARAQKDLAASKNIITALTLSAADLSHYDKNIDTFRVGDNIRVISAPHDMDQDFLLVEKTEDLLNPKGNQITLGKETASLTGSDAAGDRQGLTQLHRVEHNIRAEYQLNLAKAVEEAKTTLSSLIQQTSEQIRLEVSETYATGSEIESAIATSMTQLTDSFNFLFETLERKVDENDDNARTEFETLRKYIRFVDGDIILGEEGNAAQKLVLRIENDRIAFLDEGAEVAYFTNKKLVVLDGHFLNSLRIGAFEWVPRDNGNLSLLRVQASTATTGEEAEA
jgi:hypothetical protein